MFKSMPRRGAMMVCAALASAFLFYAMPQPATATVHGTVAAVGLMPKPKTLPMPFARGPALERIEETLKGILKPKAGPTLDRMEEALKGTLKSKPGPALERLEAAPKDTPKSKAGPALERVEEAPKDTSASKAIPPQFRREFRRAIEQTRKDKAVTDQFIK